MLTYYQKALLASLIYYSYEAVEEAYDKYGIQLLIRWRRLIKKVELKFELPYFYKELQHISFSNKLCNKNKPPYLSDDLERLYLIREMIELSKIKIKQIKKKDNPYDTQGIMYTLIHSILPNQFGFNYEEHSLKYPFFIDIPSFLRSKGLIEVILDDDMVWVSPKNYKENEEFYASLIYPHEAEGVCFVGGENLLNQIVAHCHLSLSEVIIKQNQRRRKNKQL